MPTKTLRESAEYIRGHVEGYRLGQEDTIEKLKAEIKNDARGYRCDEFVDGMYHVLEILDSIGKEESEDE